MIEVTRHCRWPPPHSRIAVLLRNPFRPEPPGSRLFARYRQPSSDAHIGTGSPAAFVVQPSVKICQTRGGWLGRVARLHGRTEEHTSELQSLMRISYAVFCLKKKKKQPIHT